MNFTTKDASEVLVAGMQSIMFRIDMEKGTVLEIVRLSQIGSTIPTNMHG
jgi:hypothetical protein